MKVLILALFLSVNILFAGGWTSGGGTCVVCFSKEYKGKIPQSFVGDLSDEILNPKNIESIEQYDLYYAKRKEMSSKHFNDFYQIYESSSNNGIFEVIRPNTNETTKSYFQRVLSRSKFLIPTFADIVEKSHSSFDILVKKRGIPPINDFTDIFKEDRPARCVLAQMARQRSVGDVHELDIDERLFFHPKHSLQSRITVYLHEDVYLYGRIKRGHESSDETHALVAQMLNSSIKWDRLFRAAKSFGIQTEETLPFITIQNNLETYGLEIEKLNAKWNSKIFELAEKLKKNPFFKLLSSQWPETFACPKIRDISIYFSNLNDRNSTLQNAIVLQELSGFIENALISPLQSINLANYSIKIYEGHRRNDLIRIEREKINFAESKMQEMDLFLKALYPIKIEILKLPNLIIKDFEDLLVNQMKKIIAVEDTGINSQTNDNLQNLWVLNIEKRLTSIEDLKEQAALYFNENNFSYENLYTFKSTSNDPFSTLSDNVIAKRSNIDKIEKSILLYEKSLYFDKNEKDDFLQTVNEFFDTTL